MIESPLTVILLLLLLLSLLSVGSMLAFPTEGKEGSPPTMLSVDEFPEEYWSRTESSDLVSEWANLSYQWLTKQSCDGQQNFTGTDSCRLMKEMPKSDIRVYSVDVNSEARYRILFPSDAAKQAVVIVRDAVLILDPFANARFGHPLLVFYVHANVTAHQCRHVFAGIYAPARNHCLYAACTGNQLQQNSSGIGAGSSSLRPSTCKEFTFLPLVHLQHEPSLQTNNRLRCYPNLVGFKKSCPALRPRSQTTHSYCNPLLTNINCIYPNDYFTKCSASEVCDNAILLSGGWNRQLGDLSSYSNLFNVKAMLMAHGFLEDNIKIFFANGLMTDDEGTSRKFRTPVYYATMKFSIRNYIKSLCDCKYYSDSFVIYLNNPVKSDGSILLWDANGDGLFDDSELYTTKEFLRDISHCQANRVIVVADQSYGDVLINAAEARFSALQNVVIFTSTNQFELSSGHRDHLTNQLLRAKYTDMCLNDFKPFTRRSHNAPIFVGSKINLLDSTLVGGPCTKDPSFLSDSSSSIYRGCQPLSVI